jgi:DNA-binding MarR family transcriptional regulator
VNDSPLLPLPATPGFLVWRLSMKWRTAVDRAVGPLGLTHAQYSLLASLYAVQLRGGRPTQRQLADHTGLEPLYVSRLARALEASGLIERAAHPTDTRAVQLTLTPLGTDVVDQAVGVVADLLETLTAPLGGVTGARTQSLMHDLQLLLDHPSPATPSESSNTD